MGSPIWLLFGVFLNLYVCEAYKILAVFPLPSKSHGILGNNMVKHLLNAGHEVTYITPFNDIQHPKLHIVDSSENKKLFNENSLDIKLIMDRVLDFHDTDFMSNLMIDMTVNTMENERIQKFLRDRTQKFDVVIGEWMFSDLYSIFAAVFECPLIWFSTIEPHWIVTNLVDGPLNPAYNNDYITARIAPFSFTERAKELWSVTIGLLKHNFQYYYKEEEAYKRLIAPVFKEQGRPVPSYDDVRYNASLLLGNTQVAIGDAVSLPQSYKHIGGYHIDDEVKPLPEDLKKIMDNAKHGVIYFSMGSNIKSKDLPAELKAGILDVFRGLKQTVIWKFEEVLPDTPKNVHIVQWAPQQSILAHSKIVLFITHGGLLSVTEAIHFGVPLIAIPVFVDQFTNSLRADQRGFGKKLDLTRTMHKELKVALDEVLDNPKYTQKVKQVSLALHDRPLKPKEELCFWVSHVVRTQGAPHLRSPALQMPLYQRLYLDLLAVILVSLLVLRAIFKRVLCMFGSQNRSKKEKKS
ncbi:UDP-glycosyltransferase UGT5-like [Anticarsia gemmatalis]|uniref:UDP-glycosyltransferase UGT5-like n=1 Tax=Anticarsia gemmatalis TaxID=129554 RepID=UPI003F76E272